MKLELIIRQLPDGRIYIKYCWRLFESYHKAYFDDIDQANEFISNLVKKTKWK